MDFVKLNNGLEIPQLGFGVCRIPDLSECQQVVEKAIETGYRLIDTAAIYQNESAVGRAMKQSGVGREKLFLTSKLWIEDFGYQETLQAFDETLVKLQTDYLDLYLLHYPFGDIFGSWKALTELYRQGRIRAIGVSNFPNDRLFDLLVNSEVIPAVNQLQTHPFLQRKYERKFLQEKQISLEAWSPFAVGRDNIFSHPVLVTIASRHQKSVAQVILRWHLQRGTIVIPKTVQPKRMQENFSVWDFQLNPEELSAIAQLDQQDQTQTTALAEIDDRIRIQSKFI
ncbi:aldo/keto reductase [Enterococcus sp. LJL120]